jgi:hypothetical protein
MEGRGGDRDDGAIPGLGSDDDMWCHETNQVTRGNLFFWYSRIIVSCCDRFFLWFIGVRCPACKGRPVLVVFGSRKSILRIYPISNWVSCPVCKDDYVTDDLSKNSTNEKGTKSQLLKLNSIERILAGIFIIVLGVYWVMSGLMTVLGLIMLISRG